MEERGVAKSQLASWGWEEAHDAFLPSLIGRRRAIGGNWSVTKQRKGKS